ncbi:MAG: S9 family peptidase [Acidobacteriota bacterium]
MTAEKLLADYSSLLARRPVARWLPDSKQVVFLFLDRGQPERERKTEVVTVDVDSARSVRFPVPGSSPRISPDGSMVAYLAGDKDQTQLWVMSARTGNTRPLTQPLEGLKAAGHSWSGDSRQIAFLTADKEGGQLWVVSVEEQKPREVTRVVGSPGTTELVWSPDSRWIAYTYRPPPKARESKAGDAKASSVVIVGEEGDVPRDSEIWLADLNSQSHRKLVSGPYAVQDLTWFPDGRSLLFTARVAFEYKNDRSLQDVRTVSVPEGKLRIVIKDSGQTLRPSLSPDGRRIAFCYDRTNLVFPFFLNLATVPVQGESPRQLTRDIFVIPPIAWAPGANRLYFTGKPGAFTRIYSATPAGEVQQLIRTPGHASGITASPDSRSLAWTSQDAQGRAEIRVARSDGQGERVLFDLTSDLNLLALGQVEEVRWKSRDGLEIAGLFIRPVGYEAGRKYPLLVEVHGGPIGGVYLMGPILNSSPLEWHLWAGRGYAVFVPDYRSSAVYGWDHVVQARERQDANDRDFDDIMSGVDYVLNTGMVDAGRMALIGHSSGAALTNWIVTRTQRFRVAVSKEGWAESHLAYGTGSRVGGNSILEWYCKGKPWEVPQNYRKNSMIEDVNNIKTPMLFISGDTNPAIALYHNEFLYSALKKQGVDTRFLVYRGEGHNILRPENQRDVLMRILDWVDSHLK